MKATKIHESKKTFIFYTSNEQKVPRDYEKLNPALATPDVWIGGLRYIFKDCFNQVGKTSF